MSSVSNVSNQTYYSQTIGTSSKSLDLPDLNKLSGVTAEQRAAKVTLSGQALTRLSLDMRSLADKGYTSLEVDTDGVPGAEVTIAIDKNVAKNVQVSIDTGNPITDAKLQDYDNRDGVIGNLIAQILRDIASTKAETAKSLAGSTSATSGESLASSTLGVA